MFLTHHIIKYILTWSFSEMPGIKQSWHSPWPLEVQQSRTNTDAHRAGLMSWQPHGLILEAGQTQSKNIYPSQMPQCLEFHHQRDISESVSTISDSESLCFRYIYIFLKQYIDVFRVFSFTHPMSLFLFINELISFTFIIIHLS